MTDSRPSALDVAIVGDGPAGAALGAACRELGLSVAVIGRGAPWRNTYGVWLDEVDLPSGVVAGRCDEVAVTGRRSRRLAAAYGVLDDDALRVWLGLDDILRNGEVIETIDRHEHALARLADGDEVAARWIVDATGAPAAPPPRAWQTAYGVVVDEPVAATVAPTDAVTLMDWSWSGTIEGRSDVPSFLYAVPVSDGWLVEHTVLAAVDAVAPDLLRAELAARLGERAVVDAEAAGRVERVAIPMGVPARVGSGRVAHFGASAGALHPATGYSVGAALRAAPRVAQSIAAGADVHAAVWPRSARRARALHDFGLDVLLGFDGPTAAAFFDAFFDLPDDRWREYLRVDTSPGAVAAAMRGVFLRAPWSVRRRLAHGDPRRLVGLLRR